MPQSVPFEVPFHDGEHTFNGVELGGVAHVVDRLDVQLCIERLDRCRFVNCQLIHKQSQRLFMVAAPHHL